MILKEIFLETNEEGKLIIDENILLQMGICKGEQIYIAYLCPSEQDRNNRFRELILTKGGVKNIEQNVELKEEAPLTIPNELMIAAGIPLEADIDVICQKGKILIQPVEAADEILPKEVLEACFELKIDPEQVRLMLQEGETVDYEKGL